jgi:hypothetical protein
MRLNVHCSRRVLIGLAMAVLSLQGLAEASAQDKVGRPPPTNLTPTQPNVVHPGRFVPPDSVRFPTTPPRETLVERRRRRASQRAN